jgi:hypothetical protein
MFAKIVMAIPQTQLDALFVRVLRRIAHPVPGRACEWCVTQNYVCGSCACDQGPTCGDLMCDGCGTHAVCYCYCPPPPIC